MKKKILIVDDSALMRRVLYDIISSDERFQVVDQATNGLEAFDLICRKQYDGIVLDVNMPKMSGIELLKELRKRKINAKIMMASTDTKEGAKTTLDALELGALDFIHKPSHSFACRTQEFQSDFLRILHAVTESRVQMQDKAFSLDALTATEKVISLVKKHAGSIGGNKVVAIASSTGGPKALQYVVPKLPKNIQAPVLIVQHMPSGFTKSLAERLDGLSEVTVKEAEEGDILQEGVVYLARGGVHMTLVNRGGRSTIAYSDEPPREGVKPCANYMYETLSSSKFSEVVCVVLTGMGADGTKGILNLANSKKVHVIAQSQETCTVYGMPRSIVQAGSADQVVPIEQIAQEIIMNVGVK